MPETPSDTPPRYPPRMTFHRELWYEWTAMLQAMQWERPIEDDWDEFRAEWFRALFQDGRDCGFIPEGRG